MLESTNAMNPAIMAGANFIFQAAGWLESGLTIGYEKFVMDAEQCGAIARVVAGLEIDDDQLAKAAYLEAGVGTNFLGVGHTMQHYKTANFRAELSDANPFEQWSEAGSKDMQQRAYEQWNRMLAEYQAPPLDPAVDAALLDFIARKKASMADAWY
jgi:trimethylamine--corrinoid protein Co-methyltransferase